MNQLAFCLIMTFGTGCSFGELGVNLWLGGPGKSLLFQNTVTAHQVLVAKWLDVESFIFLL